VQDPGLLWKSFLDYLFQVDPRFSKRNRSHDPDQIISGKIDPQFFA